MSRKTKNELHSQKINSIIGPDTLLEGNFITKETTRIEGVIRGNIKAEGTLVVGASGKIYGNVEAEHVIVGGLVEGDLTVNGKVEIIATGTIQGDITTKSLVIDENAIFQGTCTMKAKTELINKSSAPKEEVNVETAYEEENK